ncbi:ATP-binding cassette domain-containing protein [Aerococcaceae bacterium NML130460]|nr:ATP-binding cassette domain-containing protein [Aerococcaceae bacterium NML130460]
MNLTVKQLGYYYEVAHPILNEVNLTFESGKVYGIFGRSGSGKTTLAKLLAGHLLPTTGAVYLDDCILPKIPKNIQYIGQNPEEAFNPKWRLRKVVHKEANVSDTLLEALGISKAWLNRYPQELSGGQLQRIALARALAMEPNYLIADEITAMLDSVTQANIWQTLLQMTQERGIGLIVISHDYHLLEKIGAEIIEIELLKTRGGGDDI